MEKNPNFTTPVHGTSAEKESFVRNSGDADYQDLENEWGDDDDHKKNDKKDKKPNLVIGT